MNYQDEFLKMRPRLFTLAYKMMQSVVDAEDVIQETFLAVGSVKAGSVRDPTAYLVRAVINRCLKLLDKRKDTIYPGPNLPEPLEDSSRPDLDEGDLSYGLLLLLQRLKPAERAVFILKESFDLEYGVIAEIVETTPDNCRQMLHRAKGKLSRVPPVSRTTEDQLVELMGVFMAAAASGDASALIARLREDVTVYTDGGGKRLAALRPVTGPISVLKFMMGIYNKRPEGLPFSLARINGESAIVLHDSRTGLPESVMLFSFEDASLAAIYMVRNPDKLNGIQTRAV